jgi:hypothetical protein
MASDLHDYIHNILEGSDQSPSRPISFDLATLNDVIGKHVNRIGKVKVSSIRCWYDFNGMSAQRNTSNPTLRRRWLEVTRESLVGLLKILLVHSQWHAPTVSALSTGRLGGEEKVTVQNYIGNVSFECIVSTPKTLDDLLNVMAKAKRENLNVKAVGSFHAWSLVTSLHACTNLLLSVSILFVALFARPPAI